MQGKEEPKSRCKYWQEDPSPQDGRETFLLLRVRGRRCVCLVLAKKEGQRSCGTGREERGSRDMTPRFWGSPPLLFHQMTSEAHFLYYESHTPHPIVHPRIHLPTYFPTPAFGRLSPNSSQLGENTLIYNGEAEVTFALAARHLV